MGILILIREEDIVLEIDSRNSWEKSMKIVHQLDLEGNFIREYKSISMAQEITGIRHIGECANGKRKTAGGYRWIFPDI